MGDNEARLDLFLYRLDGDGRPVAQGQALRLDLNREDEVSDIEALTRSASGRLFLFGSHGRNAVCDAKKKRRRFGSIETLHEQPITIKLNKTSERISCDEIFVDAVRKERLIESICNLIQEKEDAADLVDDRFREKEISEDVAKAECNEIAPYNAEGAVDIAAAGATPNLWIGLRSPLLAWHPSQPERQDLALLLHLRDLDAYKFDGAALLDLDGRGVRDLAMAADGWVWLLAGPPQDLRADDAEPFQLWRFRDSDLRRDNILRPELVRDDLPNSSEGLAMIGEHAIVVIDGDEGDECGVGCSRASSYLLLKLPVGGE